MPLSWVEVPPAELSKHLPSDGYVIFYSSIVNDQLWCPDCRDVEAPVREAFSAPDAPSAVIVYVGDRPTWKSPTNAFRGEPWKVTSIPTIVKLTDGKEQDRLVESEIIPKLKVFVGV
ncbi:hypothetical protein VNI00_002177 [Paramarasmius palmivorus]|uniref:Thioredoxin domain-containing protein n=1 Tax=Paramarasmius palmivorus TaxID=297713 RepID=A0AAW0E0D6_9AGAR